MTSIRFRSQQSLSEAQRPIDAGPRPRHARALLEHVAARARAEQKALKSLLAKQTPNRLLDLTPGQAIGTLTGHYDDLAAITEDETAALERLVLGVSVIAALSKKLGRSPDQIRAMDVHTIAKHVSLPAAVAARDAFFNADVAMIANGHAPAGAFTWERGATYANADHLTSTFEEIGLRLQSRVAIARDFYGKGGGGRVGGATLAALDSMDEARAGVDEVVDVASAYYARTSGAASIAGAIAASVGAAAAEVALSPATVVSANVPPDDQGAAAVELLGMVGGLGARARRSVSVEPSVPKPDPTLKVEVYRKPRTKTMEIEFKELPKRRGAFVDDLTDTDLDLPTRKGHVVVDGRDVTRRIRRTTRRPAEATTAPTQPASAPKPPVRETIELSDLVTLKDRA